MSTTSYAIPEGSWVLITGITGFLPSHVAKQLLDRGFKVRGTTRDVAAASWVKDEMFADAARRGALEIVALDFTTSDDEAYAAAVKGVSAINHVASIQTMDPNPDNVIPPSLRTIDKLLQQAAKEPNMKRFVYTSSSVAAFMPNPFPEDETLVIGRDSWNDFAIDVVNNPRPELAPMMGPIIYSASKAMTEKRVWTFAAEQRPHFEVNVVSPYTLVGPILHKKLASQSLPSWINALWHGKVDVIGAVPCLDFVSVKDVAVLHVAATLDADVKSERMQAWVTPFNWNDVLAMWREKYPHRKFVDDLPNMGRINVRIDDALPKQLLKKWNGQDGWISIEDGFNEAVESLLAAEEGRL